MKKRNIIKVLICAAFAAVCVYTVSFGTIKSPIEYTISKIGNYFDLREGFILWGAITGILLVVCIAYIYRSAGCKDVSSDRFLALSYAFLIMTVLVPNIKEISWTFFYIHVITATLFACSLLLSIVLFMRYLYIERRSLFQKSLKLLILCVSVPLAIIAIYGKLTGLAEISFFVGISVFFVSLNIRMATGKKTLAESGLTEVRESGY